MTESLQVLVDGKLVGYLQNKNGLTFNYAQDCLSGLVKAPFSRLIPLKPGEISDAGVYAYFENLLPEGDQRKALEDKHHVTSIFGLLAMAGGDTAGAVVIVNEGLAQLTHQYIPKTWDGIAKIIAGHGMPQESSKVSISGAQYKLLLSIDPAGNPLIPVGASPSTHILKPNIQRQGQKIWGSAVNETIIMRAAQHCGLPVAKVQYIGVAQSCLVERYDRRVENGEVKRLHQLDFCQLLHIPSNVKYENDGGPSLADCYAHVKSASTNPVSDCDNLLKWFFFNLFTGNNDSHAKNISMLADPSRYRLAPFYDLMCTSVYPGLSNDFAFKVGNTRKPGEVDAEQLNALAASLAVSSRYMHRLADDMAAKIDPAIQTAIEELRPAFEPLEVVMAERIAQKVKSLCKKRAVKLKQ